MNKVFLMGRLVANPELRHTNTNNVPVATFRLAVDRRSKNNETDFFDIVCWDKQADFVCRWFIKGLRVAVVGRLQNRKWQDKDGNNRVTTEIVAEECHFADSKQTDTQGGQQYAGQSQQYSGYPAQGYGQGYAPPPGYAQPPQGYAPPPGYAPPSYAPPQVNAGVNPAQGNTPAFGDKPPEQPPDYPPAPTPAYTEASFQDLADEDDELPF